VLVLVLVLKVLCFTFSILNSEIHLGMAPTRTGATTCRRPIPELLRVTFTNLLV